MMREKYESLPLATLKELAKARGLKGISTMKKAELIELMLKEDEKEKNEDVYAVQLRQASRKCLLCGLRVSTEMQKQLSE